MTGSPTDEKTWKLRSPSKESSGLRWIYDLEGSGLAKGGLLLGDDLGKLILLRWTKSPDGAKEQQTVVADSPEPSGSVVFVDDWDDTLFLVSYRNRDARLVPKGQLPRGISAERMAKLPVLAGVQGVCGMMRYRGMDPLLICENGALWRVRKVHSRWVPAPEEKRCEEPEQPGFISDTMQVELDSPSGHRVESRRRGARQALYLATDLGLYLLRWHGDRPEVRKVHLPGISGTCMAVSYVKKEGRHFLWVSDLAGDVHMFWKESEKQGEAPLYWQRYGFRLDSSRAVRSIASFGPLDKVAFAICQACRDEKVVVTWYGLESRDPRNASYVLSWGTLEDLEIWRPDLRSDHLGWEQWCPEARLAACIEQAGSEPGQFAQFLSSPKPERLAWEVLRKIASVERGRQAVVLWTDALLGTVHRRLGERRQQQSLGVIRWLRRLAERCRRPGKGEEWMQGLLGDIEDCIRHARKWGVFGGTYAQRQEVFGPLAALEAQQVGDRQLDSIAYRTLLFGRRVDVEDEKPEKPRRRRVPWDVQYLPEEGSNGRRGWIAVSWGGSGVDLYRIEPQPQGGSRSVLRFDPVPDKEEGPAGNREREHSRSLVLGFLSTSEGRRRSYFLHSPAQAAGPEDSRRRGEVSLPERLHLSFFDSATGEIEQSFLGAVLPPGESVYSLLRLTESLVLVGLRGVKGSARLAVARIWFGGVDLLADANDPELLFLELPAAYPELNHIKLNPVWSLTSAGPQRFPAMPDDLHEVVAGCGDGQIWKVRLRIGLQENAFTLEGEALPVGRLGAPVRALAVRPAIDLLSERVVAGGADGTILAYQKVGEAYVSLWATREGGAIARLHTFEADLSNHQPGEDLEGARRLILAVTQEGVGVLFSDRERVETIDDLRCRTEEVPHRLHVPGERLGRLSLGSTVFASTLVGEGAEGDAEGQVARLAVASSEGVLRLLTLHYPKYTELRQGQFQKIRHAWMEVLRGGRGSGQEVHGHLLRRAEALYAAVPHLSAVMVRWILGRDGGSPGDGEPWSQRDVIGAEASGPGRQWIPRHLQPLIDLDAAWAELGRARDENERRALAARLSGSFTEALRAARDVRDSRLFKEILEVTLNRANHQLFRQMRGVTQALQEAREPVEVHAEWFIALLNCLMDVKGAWLGAPENIDTRIRVVIVRNLVDGDTLWSLSEALRWAQGDLREEIEWIVERRIQQIHEFLAKGDPLLSLEVLRAVNLSLARACRRLDPNEELTPKTIEGYYETVGDFASRSVHSTRNELGEALAHEIGRTYALGMLACSSFTLRLTHRMSEADLPPDFAKQTFDQFYLLPSVLKRSMSPDRLQIFRIASGLEMGHGRISDENLLSRRVWKQGLEELGEDNRNLIEKGKIFDEIVSWLYRLADRFSSRPESVDLEQAFTYRDQCAEPKADDPFSHSRMFWSEALQEFCAICKDGGFPSQRDRSTGPTSLENVRPDLVLLSRPLSLWCEEQQRKLNDMKQAYKIFDPQRPLYSRALSALKEATKGFREGVSLQKNIVQGVLSHGLLEMLDEHLLGLWEVAQALDPEQTWKREDRSEQTVVTRGQRRSRAARFADAMLNTALKAEVIPKNLRNLQWLLSYDSEETGANGSVPEEYAGANDGQRTLSLMGLLLEFTGEEYGWKIESLQGGIEPELELRESHFLRFILNELADNQGHNPVRPEPPIVVLKAESSCSVHLTFCCHSSKKDRINKLRETKLQHPIPPDNMSCMRSHGMGLYLANLAAGAVGWQLTIEDPEVPDPERIPFVLLRKG